MTPKKKNGDPKLEAAVETGGDAAKDDECLHLVVCPKKPKSQKKDADKKGQKVTKKRRRRSRKKRSTEEEESKTKRRRRPSKRRRRKRTVRRHRRRRSSSRARSNRKMAAAARQMKITARRKRISRKKTPPAREQYLATIGEPSTSTGIRHKSPTVKTRRYRKKKSKSYGRYLITVLQGVHPDLRMTRATVRVLDSLLNDILARMGRASRKLRLAPGGQNRVTLGTDDMFGATRLVFSRRMSNKAMTKGIAALDSYHRTKKA